MGTIRWKLGNLKRKIKMNSYFIKLCNRNKKIVYFIGSEDYGNIGDHHIAVSEIKFIQNVLKDRHIEEVTSSEFDRKIDYVRKYIRKQDIICTQGGGNFGNRYMNAEDKRRRIIQYFPDNKIIVFPQTIHYENSDAAKKEFDITKNIIDNHPDLYIFSREEESYRFVNKNFNTKSYIAPDIVLSDRYDRNTKREGFALCLRHDVERSISDKDEKFIDATTARFTDKVIKFDTQLKYNVPKADRDEEIARIIDVLQNARIAITDRLHGMVFCAITGTPCIVMSNYNHKVKGVYRWIKDLKYIRFLEDISQLEELINELLALEEEDCVYPYEEIIKEFLPLKEVLENE